MGSSKAKICFAFYIAFMNLFEVHVEEEDFDFQQEACFGKEEFDFDAPLESPLSWHFYLCYKFA